MFDDKLMTRLCVNPSYMLYFVLWLRHEKWRCEVNISAPPHSGQVVYSLGDMLAPPRIGQMVCSLSGNDLW